MGAFTVRKNHTDYHFFFLRMITGFPIGNIFDRRDLPEMVECNREHELWDPKGNPEPLLSLPRHRAPLVHLKFLPISNRSKFPLYTSTKDLRPNKVILGKN